MKQYYKYYEKKINRLQQQHSEEISRLRDQIYILQNSFNDYISFNSINTDYKKRLLNRHVPVVAFFDTRDEGRLEKCHQAVIRIMKAAGFAFVSHEKSHIGVNEYMTRSTDELSLDQVYERINEIARCLNGNGNDCQNDKLRTLSKELIEITENIPSFLVKAGSALTVKTTNEEGKSRIRTTSLPISAQIHIDKNPALLKNPTRLMQEINHF